jgi:hypothetical protein
MANYLILQHSDLIKRGPERLDNFLDMIKEGIQFLTTKGLVVLDKKVDLNALRSAMLEKGYSNRFKGTMESGQIVELLYPKDFYKTEQFGGKGAGSGTAAEDRNLKIFRSEIRKVLDKTSELYFMLDIGGRKVKCSDCITVPAPPGRAPKADFAIIDPEGNHVAWISHKDGSRPQDFQQYGGLSGPAFASSSEVKKFMTDLSKLYPNGLESGISIQRPVEDKKVIMKSIYGIDFGSSTRGINNVDEFHQGSMSLNKLGESYKIKSVHSGKNGDVIKGSGYEPIYFARFTTDRGANICNIFVGKARIGVFPADKAVKTTKTI